MRSLNQASRSKPCFHPLLSASACIGTVPPPQKHTKLPSHHTGPTKCCIIYQWIFVPYFPLGSLCCQKYAGLRSALELNWSRKLFHWTAYDYGCNVAVLHLSRWIQPASLIWLKFRSKQGCLQGLLVPTDLVAAYKDAFVWRQWVMAEYLRHKYSPSCSGLPFAVTHQVIYNKSVSEGRGGLLSCTVKSWHLFELSQNIPMINMLQVVTKQIGKLHMSFSTDHKSQGRSAG